MKSSYSLSHGKKLLLMHTILLVVMLYQQGQQNPLKKGSSKGGRGHDTIAVLGRESTKPNGSSAPYHNFS
jgi:hypothetical protein